MTIESEMISLPPSGSAERTSWCDLIEALSIFRRHAPNVPCPTHCEHDELTVCAPYSDFPEEALRRLEELGFREHYDEDCFLSWRFGSA